MKLSSGTDLVRIDRITRAAQRWGDHFLGRIFTEAELRYCFARHSPWQSLAARFAAKEAFFKAVPERGLRWTDVEIVVDGNGAPSFALAGRAAAAVAAGECSLSLSHDGDYALAFVVVAGPGTCTK